MLYKFAVLKTNWISSKNALCRLTLYCLHCRLQQVVNQISASESLSCLIQFFLLLVYGCNSHKISFAVADFANCWYHGFQHFCGFCSSAQYHLEFSPHLRHLIYELYCTGNSARTAACTVFHFVFRPKAAVKPEGSYPLLFPSFKEVMT